MSDRRDRSRHVRLAGTVATALTLSVAVAGTGALLPVAPAVAGPVEVKAPEVPGFADVISAVTPAVVSVRVKSRSPSSAPRGDSGHGIARPFGGNPIEHLFDSLRGADPDGTGGGGIRPVAQGSGFFISQDGYVVTNDDVVADGNSFEVILSDGTTLDAKLVGEDARTDLAVLKVAASDRKFTYVAFADDSKVRIGDWIVAVGNPYGLGGTVTAGIVSARGRDVGAAPYDDFIQFDAPVNRGDAGGPAFNLSGQVVGVNAALFSPVGGSVGIAYAIPSSTVSHVAQELIRNGSIRRGWLGVALQPVTRDIADSVGMKSARGALVADVDPHAPARSAGLSAGEIITSVDGKNVSDPRDLASAIGALHPGETVKLGIWHDGAASTASVRLGSMPSAKAGGPSAPGAPPGDMASSPLGKFGLKVVASEEGRGAVITDIAADSVAEHRGLRAGDVILSVDGKPAKSADDILGSIRAAAKKGRKAVLFRLENGNRSRFVALPVNLG